MKRFFITACITLGLSVAVKAQAVRETRLNILEADRMGFVIEFPYEQKVVGDAWNKKADELKIKSKPSKGWDVYTGVTVPDLHYEGLDIYVKIDKVDKARTNFSFSVSKGTTNFITNEEGKLVANVNRFLDAFILYTDQYKLKLDITAQEDLIKSTQKDYTKQVDDGKKLQEQIDRNKIDQENSVKKIEAMNLALEELKKKVK